MKDRAEYVIKRFNSITDSLKEDFDRFQANWQLLFTFAHLMSMTLIRILETLQEIRDKIKP